MPSWLLSDRNWPNWSCPKKLLQFQYNSHSAVARRSPRVLRERHGGLRHLSLLRGSFRSQSQLRTCLQPVSKAAKQILFRFGCVDTCHIFSYLFISFDLYRLILHPDFHNVSTAAICNSHATQYNKMQESIRKLKHSWGRFYGVSCFPAHPNLLVGEVSMNQTQVFFPDSDKVL